VVTGHPKFDQLLKLKKEKKDLKKRELLLAKYGIRHSGPVIVFYSHPVRSFYPDKVLGYDETDVFPVLFNAVERLREDMRVNLVFKEHPREAALIHGIAIRAILSISVMPILMNFL